MKIGSVELNHFFSRKPRLSTQVAAPPTFKAYVALCVHRDIKVATYKKVRQLEMCPNPKIEVHVVEGDADICRSRSRAATDFLLNTDCDVLFFIDDDIVFDPLDVRKVMRLCYDQHLDIVGAPYAIKREANPNFAIRALTNKEEFVCGKDGKVYEIMYLSTGFMAIHRQVLMKMKESGQFHLCNPDSLRFYPFFMQQQRQIGENWLYLSEDWSFCQVARDLGFKVWMDTTTKLGHIGPKTYDWDDFVRPAKKVQENVVYAVDYKLD